jgi:hypothetical protein
MAASAPSSSLLNSNLYITMSGEDEEYFIPLEDQRVFGAGIKRKRVQFVPSTTQDEGINSTENNLPPESKLADRYLSIVMSKSMQTQERADSVNSNTVEGTGLEETQEIPICKVCSLPLSTQDQSHESSIAHQACMPHSHPPSHLDRERKGLKYLSSYGWDPDSRLGLGAEGRGIRIPIKPKEKNDNAGVGVKVSKISAAPKKKVVKLNAKQSRLKALEDQKRSTKLRQKFYMNDDVARYLGEP